MHLLTAALLALCLALTRGDITEIPLPLEMQMCFDHAKLEPPTVGEIIYTRCVQRLLFKQHAQSVSPAPLGDDAKRWISGLVEMSRITDDPGVKGVGSVDLKTAMADMGIRPKRQAVPTRAPGRQPRIRREYRQLSDVERSLFHRAINMMKADTSVLPNKFDALGRLHFLSVSKAHFGPAFLPWHRLFLVVMENALREKIPSVTIPYWDTTLDDELLDPRSSIIWTPEFLGSANGHLVDGPFANWDTPFGQLVRQFGLSGTMLNWTYIHNAFRQNHLKDITAPYAKPDNNLEEHHNQVHVWVGGHMTPPGLAAFDPVFYLLHSYVDLIWEIFRGLQQRRNIDPTIDYPMNNTEIPEGHRYNDSSGFGLLKNRHGLSNVFTDNIYKYDRPPSCSLATPDCQSPYLRCVTSGVTPKCVSASIFDIRPMFMANGLPMSGGSGIRELRSVGGKAKRTEAKFINTVNHISDVKCDGNNVNKNYQNSFLIDGTSDKTMWVYVPVEIVFRNKESNALNSTPVYEVCTKQNREQHPYRVILESNGMNYNGLFKEISHFRNNIQADSSLVYVGVRKPTSSKSSEVILSAYDSCGRICQPYCLDKYDKRKRKCVGAINIHQRIPYMYGDDVTSVVNTLWKEDANGLPILAKEELFLTFVCDTTLSFWPWSNN